MTRLRTDRYKIKADKLSRKSQRIILRALEEVVELEDGRAFYDADFEIQLFVRTATEQEMSRLPRPRHGGTQPLILPSEEEVEYETATRH